MWSFSTYSPVLQLALILLLTSEVFCLVLSHEAETSQNGNVALLANDNSRERRSPGEDLEFAGGKGEDHEGGTWYLGKRTGIFVALKNQKPQTNRSFPDYMLAPGQWPFRRPTTASPAGNQIGGSDGSSSGDDSDAPGRATEAPQIKRSRSPWGFHRSTKAAWYLGKRSLVPFNSFDTPDDLSIPEEPAAPSLNSPSPAASALRPASRFPNELLRAAKMNRGRLRTMALFAPAKGRDSKWNLWYLGKR